MKSLVKKEKMTIADIRSAYTKDKKALDKKSGLWGYYVNRRISFYVAWLFIRLGIPANKVSLLSIIFLLAGCTFLAFGEYKAILLGAILLNIYLLLDYTDGNIARYTNKVGSPLGAFLENFSGFIDKSLIYISAGIGAFLNPGYLPVGTFGWIFVLLGVLTAILHFVTPATIAGFMKCSFIEGSGITAEHFMFSGFTLYRIARQAIGGFYLGILLIFAISNCLGIFVILYALIAVGLFAGSAFKYLAKLPLVTNMTRGGK